MKSTTDIGFVTFLDLEGHKLKDYVKDQNGIATFSFDISEEEWKLKKIEYHNSRDLKFKTRMQNIKNMLR